MLLEGDADGELEALLSMARDLYSEEVSTGQKTYARFADDFFHSVQFTSCEGVPFKNLHNRNVHIVRGILLHEEQARRFLFAATFSHHDFLKLMAWYDHLGENPPTSVPCENVPPNNTRQLSLHCCLTQEQMVCIVKIANANHLFCVKEVTLTMMKDLFSCKEGFRITVNNIARTATLFDALLDKGLIARNWQKTMEQGRFLISGKTGKPLSATTLSSALCGAHRSKSITHTLIRRELRDKLKRGDQLP